MSQPRRREDLLVSIGFAEIEPTAEAFAAVRQLANTIDQRFRFWEFVAVVNADEAERFKPLIAGVPNLRLLKVRRVSDFYRKRAVVASEAIGDVVVLTAVEELPAVDFLDMIDRAASQGAIVLAQRGENGAGGSTFLNPLLRPLGRAGGFRVDTRDLLSAAFPRTLLNQVMAHPDRQLALRFPPRDAGIPVLVVESGDTASTRRSFRDLGRRLGLIEKLLVNLAPRVLMFVALTSFAVTVLAVGYALYAIGAWLILTEIQPGWLTISLMLSFVAALLGTALFGISLGLQRVLDTLSPATLDDVVDEQSAVDLFGQVAKDLNVEIETEAAGSERLLTPPARPTPVEAGE